MLSCCVVLAGLPTQQQRVFPPKNSLVIALMTIRLFLYNPEGRLIHTFALTNEILYVCDVAKKKNRNTTFLTIVSSENLSSVICDLRSLASDATFQFDCALLWLGSLKRKASLSKEKTQIHPGRCAISFRWCILDELLHVKMFSGFYDQWNLNIGLCGYFLRQNSEIFPL